MRRLVPGLAAALSLACAGRTGQGAAPAPIAAQPSPLTAAEIAAVPNPHATPGRPHCASCHTKADAAELREDPNATCQRCHSFQHGNHPVAVVQKDPVPGIPLLAGGRVACHSCHDPHNLRKEKHGLRMEFNALCMSCHRKTTGPAHDMHGAKPKAP